MTAWRRFTERSAFGLLALLAFGLLLLLVRAEWPPLHALDHAVAADLNAVVSRHEPLVAALRGISVLGGPPVTPLLVAVVAAGLLLRRRVRPALYLVVTGLGALILDPTLKTLVGRLRPIVDVPIAAAPGHSFPSGHALGTVVAYGAVLLILVPVLGPFRRRVAIAAWATLVVLVGFTRVALGVHFVSDVVGGCLLGLAWLGITTHAFRLSFRTGGLDPAPHPALPTTDRPGAAGTSGTAGDGDGDRRPARAGGCTDRPG
ncbi:MULTISPECIES: phosphatase PAP2 family protein [Catenuloplanes]|uniref:Membrane-associated phospholipid phosphatase n=1 Tax=Catenuloplanes niger TaxID=587534 RepID=A0AAE3ZUV9_9ACTN|nr:phosphatase PAP2 family protein [Catenuloplanes niger]MDR7325367.1 membrane-associated phospholipid phosphatase [Catenuloplanes niger]